MSRPQLGTKRTCVACSAKFYDLSKTPAICPKCGVTQPAEQPRLRVRAPVPEPKVKAVAVADDVDADVEVEAEDDAEDGVLEDTSDLDDDTDPLGADIEVGADTDDSER